jgi:hypothetical protein
MLKGAIEKIIEAQDVKLPRRQATIRQRTRKEKIENPFIR